MNKREFVTWLNEVETTLPVADWRVGGVPVWPLIRLQLFSANFDASLWPERVGGGAWPLASGAVRALGAWAHARIIDRRRNARPDEPADAVFLAVSYGTQPTIAGRRYNWLLAPYVELLASHGRTAAVWEMCPGGDYNIPRFTPSHYVQPYLFYERIASLVTRRHRAMAVVLPEFAPFVARTAAAGLKTRYGAVEALQRDASFVRRLADGFRVWLRSVRPRYGFVVDCWLREQAFCLACREEDVIVVDLQHGIQGELHPAYGSWQGSPVGGYLTRPSVFWCWDEASAAAIDAWAAPARAAVTLIGGDPWREMWRADASDLAAAFDKEIADRRRAAGGDRHILLNLDPVGPVIPDMVAEVLRRAPAGWCFWVRLHPVNQRARLPEAIRRCRELGIRHVDPAVASRLPLHALLKHVDVHLTVSWSTVIVEAADFGVSSVACASRAGEIYPQNLANGTLRIATSADTLLRLLETQAARAIGAAEQPRHDPRATMGLLLEGAAPGRRGAVA